MSYSMPSIGVVTYSELIWPGNSLNVRMCAGLSQLMNVTPDLEPLGGMIQRVGLPVLVSTFMNELLAPDVPPSTVRSIEAWSVLTDMFMPANVQPCAPRTRMPYWQQTPQVPET